MPLLHRKPFIRQRPPPDLEPTERLFYCRVTNEVFRDYDEFFERTILCNSLVWSCSLTGKSDLTYPEALESEKKIRQSLQTFPQPLIVPILHLASLSRHHRVTDLCEDIFGYVKNRYFVGETVNVVRNSGARLECKVLEVKLPPLQNGIANGHSPHNEDTIVISDSDDESSKASPQNGTKKEPIDPSLLKYKVKPIKKELYESVTVKSSQLSRTPSLFSQERLKLFLKLHCESQNGIIKPKAISLTKHEVSEKKFFQYFPDDPPSFQRTPTNKIQTGRPSTNKHLKSASSLSREKKMKAAREQERILKHKNELKAMEMEKARMRREQGEMDKNRIRERQCKDREREEQKKMIEEERLRRKEEIERNKLEKEKEREKIREEKRKYAEHLKLWSKPREDMECDDLKELPLPTSVKTRIPPECFGDAIMVLEFLHAFGDLFDLVDEFPDGMTFEMLEEALVGNNPEGPLCELLFFFLTAIFQAMTEEEEEVAKDQIIEAETKDLTEALDEVTDPTKSAYAAVASLAAAWPQLHQGCSLKDLDLDSCTLSEILRLHILSSGADANSASAKYRYQKQGGFDATDDACMELRLSHPVILKKLSSVSVYALTPGEKLMILHALCGKLLTLVSTRDYIEDYFEELRQAKQEFRELKSEQNRRGREGAAARIRKRKVDKLKEQEMKMKDKHEKLKEEESSRGAGNEDDLDTSSENKDPEQKDQDSEDEDTSYGQKGNKTQNGLMYGKNCGLSMGVTLEKKGALTPEEQESLRQKQQKKEQELLEKIQEATACTNIFPLGRDRWYRRFWTFYSVPGLFVEEDYYGLTEDMLQPRPISHRDALNLALNSHAPPDQNINEELPKPVTKPNRWWFYYSTEQLDELIECLNTRGYRETSLKDILVQEKNKISQKLTNLPVNRFHLSDNPLPIDSKPGRGRSQQVHDTAQVSAEKQLQLRLCDLLLDIEDRIYQGTLGSVKVPDRQAWRASIEKCVMEILSDEAKENGGIKVSSNDIEEMEGDSKPITKDRLQGLKNETPSATSTSTNTPQPVNNTLRFLARALLQIEQGVERRFLKAPLGDAEDTKRDKKSAKKKDEEQTEKDDACDGGRIQRTVLDRWRESLLSSGSLSQIFLHLSTLDRSILWSRSILNARCKVCRKKGDSECMLLCDGCDRGHHIYCVRPKLKYVPEGDWFCPECRPKQRMKRPPARQRPSVESDEEEMESAEEESEEEVSEEEEEEDYEEQSVLSEEDSPPKRGKAKVHFPLKKSGRIGGKPGPKKKGGKASKVFQGTPKTFSPSPRGRGRGRGTGRKTRSAPPLGSKTSFRQSTRNTQANTDSPGNSLVGLVSIRGKGLGRGRGSGRGRGRGRGRMQKSADNTPVGSPFALRPFSLDSPDHTPQRGRGQSKNSMTIQIHSSGRGKKRLSTDHISADQANRRSSGRNQGVHELSACEQLVVELVRHDDSWPFMKLVSKIQVPDYFDIIQKPIALNVIREKVNKCEYKSASEFVEDVELMFSNCFEYNHFNSNEARAGVRLQSFFANEAEKLGLEVSCSKTQTPLPPSKRSRI
ncbi:bromodomain adjacent to zinc finger domain protein 1A [Pelobates fuscus]|uniref:bromodomain adjacent to zinc finger domain protein 1A n=1 Tax=Pelobates fuscus TaxID=191477 RepID=UPI002FE46EEA